MTVGVLVRVTVEERQRWKDSAAEEGLSVSELVRRSVSAAISEEQGS